MLYPFFARLLAVTAAVAALTSAASASPKCTTEPKDKWIKEADFKAKIDAMGYSDYKKILVTGSCYEIYGKNKAGKKVEVYFNPIDGKVVEEEVEK